MIGEITALDVELTSGQAVKVTTSESEGYYWLTCAGHNQLRGRWGLDLGNQENKNWSYSMPDALDLF